MSIEHSDHKRSGILHITQIRVGAVHGERDDEWSVELAVPFADLGITGTNLLFEAGAEGRVDEILVILVDPAVQLQRLLERDMLSETEARQRIVAQWPQADKVQKADYVIDNSGPLAQTRMMVEALYDYLLRRGSLDLSIA